MISEELFDVVTYLETIRHKIDQIFFTVQRNYRKVSE